MTRFVLDDAAAWIARPAADDDKYSRGVLGVVTGSQRYPGAAVLGVEAAVRTGVGMVRYRGADAPTGLVLQRRPEAVAAPGRVQAWLLGSGLDAGRRDPDDTARLRDALTGGGTGGGAGAVPCVIDAGALDLIGGAGAPSVITPHYRELSRVLAAAGVEASAGEIAADPEKWARETADRLGVTVLLKGNVTRVAAPAGEVFTVSEGTAWLATAGSGDVLGGILGALLATHATAIAERGHEVLARLAAVAAAVHGAAGAEAVSAHGGGAIAALDVAEAVPFVIGRLIRGADGAHIRLL